MKTRKPIKRSGKPVARRNAARKTYLKHSTKRIRSVNPKAQAKRKIGYRKMLASKEYKAVRAEAMERAGNRCEWNDTDGLLRWDGGPPFGLGRKGERDPFRNDPSRCEMTMELHAHHLRYPKSRPVAATDLAILCKWHHRTAESQKMHKMRMF